MAGPSPAILPIRKIHSIIKGEIMPHEPITTEIKIRFPVEMTRGIEHWAASRQVPRSKAIRELIYRGLARPEQHDTTPA
jgi:hypothetical protein